MPQDPSEPANHLRHALRRRHGAIAAEYAIAAVGLVVASILAGAAMGDWGGATLARAVGGILR